MEYEFPMGAPQGWQCPICKRVYSPTTPFCYYCGGSNGTPSTTTKPIEIVYTGTSTDSEHKTLTDEERTVDPAFIPDYLKDPRYDSHFGMPQEG